MAQATEEHQAFRSEEGLWGVGGDNWLIYEPEFCRITAEAIADMYNAENPPEDWHETARRLTLAGLPF